MLECVCVPVLEYRYVDGCTCNTCAYYNLTLLQKFNNCARLEYLRFKVVELLWSKFMLWDRVRGGACCLCRVCVRRWTWPRNGKVRNETNSLAEMADVAEKMANNAARTHR